MKNFFKHIFSMQEKDNIKTIKFFGIKIKKVQRKNILKDLSYRIQEHEKYLFNIMQDKLISKIVDNSNPMDIIQRKLKNIKYSPKYLWTTSEQNYLNILLGVEPIQFKDIFDIDNTYIVWGIRPNPQHIKTMNHALEINKGVLFIEDGFLRSADTFANGKVKNKKYIKGISFTADDLSCYFDATKTNRLEQMLNDKNLIITEEQKARARNCINKIIQNHLTKYNHQPIFKPVIGKEGKKKVLVIDQTFGDMSILKGLADENTFKTMLETAIKENPDADIIVKTHPDVIHGTKSGYYTDIKEGGNIYLQKEPINPIALINSADKVYVCTTQFGFEALMCGKEVHTFGMPFYAGWGLTIDAQTCERRTNKRTLEEVFYIAYIMYSHYVNPLTNSECEIEDAMDYLLQLREEYNKLKRGKNE